MIDAHTLYRLLNAAQNEMWYERSADFDRLLAGWCALVLDEEIFSMNECTPRQPPAQPYAVAHAPASYRVIGIDGSQVYPDRHEGIDCALINVGGIKIAYGADARVELFNEPLIHTMFDELTASFVDALRQEYELKAAVEFATRDDIVLFDGSLVFWNLLEKNSTFQDRFMSAYNVYLTQLYEQKILYAGYTSLPYSRDLVAMVCDYEQRRGALPPAGPALPFVDGDLMGAWLASGQRSALFDLRAPLLDRYVPYARPVFLYISVGEEIGRVEVPAWIADNAAAVDLIAQVVLDQAHKGFGYPLVLAEAHEQVVVKYTDRALFVNMLCRLAQQRGQRVVGSRKRANKRRLAV